MTPDLKTEFWQNAASKLPAAVRARHIVDIQRAERVEILVDRIINAWSLVKALVTRAPAPAPRATHQH